MLPTAVSKFWLHVSLCISVCKKCTCPSLSRCLIPLHSEGVLIRAVCTYIVRTYNVRTYGSDQHTLAMQWNETSAEGRAGTLFTYAYAERYMQPEFADCSWQHH